MIANFPTRRTQFEKTRPIDKILSHFENESQNSLSQRMRFNYPRG